MRLQQLSAQLTAAGLHADARPPVDGVAVPFVCTDDSGAGNVRELRRRRVLQCALSRVCAVCAQTLDNPLHLVGTTDEADDNAFRIPPVHAECVAGLLTVLTSTDGAAVGHPAGLDRRWAVVTTGGFDLVRPTGRDGLHLFRPNAVTARRGA
ncbi:hypothetical protein [Nocardioides alkalitolerans]|uniref:hypothetical protein n=1 Tax=Nocardioides alkalitolerans TaxID=281714 RepID=UPI0004200835|nr:hypothetical protein [Nocardioides alkalitolerans]